MTCEGIYRLSAPKLRLDDLRLSVEQGDDPVFQDATEAGALLKLYLREMPDHLLTNELIGHFEDAAKGLYYLVILAGRHLRLIGVSAQWVTQLSYYFDHTLQINMYNNI